MLDKDFRMAKARLIQIYYEDQQKSACFPFADLYFNESLTIFFENAVIKDLVSTSEDEKIAVCSWKLREKLRWRVGRRTELTEEALNSDYEVLSFTRNTKHHQMLAIADQHHHGFKVAMEKICAAIGIKMPHEVKTPIYQNHFSARIDIYKDYVNRFLSPAMDVITNDKEINSLAMKDSRYSELDKATKDKLDNLERKIGLRYYPLVPFLLERLFSVYCHNNKINVTWL